MSFPVVEINCTNRDVTKVADVLEWKPNSLKVVVQGTELAINMTLRGDVYVGSQVGLEFVCSATYNEICAQKEPSK